MTARCRADFNDSGRLVRHQFGAVAGRSEPETLVTPHGVTYVRVGHLSWLSKPQLEELGDMLGSIRLPGPFRLRRRNAFRVGRRQLGRGVLSQNRSDCIEHSWHTFKRQTCHF